MIVPTHTIHGHVLDEAGHPVAGASVRVFPVDASSVEGLSGGDGAFAIPMPKRCHDLIEVVAPGFADRSWPLTENPLELRLQPGVALRLRCIEASGAEVPEVSLFLSRADGSGRGVTTGVAWNDHPDRWALGVYTLRAYKPGYQFVHREITLTDATELEVRMEPAGERSVRFRITGASAEQLQQALCLVELVENETKARFSHLPMSGHPDEHGLCVIDGMPKSLPLHLEVRIPGMRAHPRFRTVWPHERDGVLEVPFAMRARPERTVHGRFVDEAGRGVGPLTFLVGEDLAGCREGTTDAEGRFVITTTMCDGELLRLWLAPGPRVVDSPTSLHRTARTRHLHVLEMPCDHPIDIPTIAARSVDTPPPSAT